MKFFTVIFSILAFYFCKGQSSCPVCDSTNNAYTEAIAPKQWVELVKDPQKIDKYKFQYGRVEAELAISNDGKITGFRFNGTHTNHSDSTTIDSLIKLSLSWTPAKICNYTFESKKAVLFYVRPYKITEGEYGCYHNMVYLSPIFSGGLQSWNQFVQKNLQSKIVLSPTEKNKYCQNAIVQFCIDKEGILTDTKIINKDSLHPLQIEEIKKLSSKALKWWAGEWSGRKIAGTFTTIIQFQFIDAPIS